MARGRRCPEPVHDLALETHLALVRERRPCCEPLVHDGLDLDRLSRSRSTIGSGEGQQGADERGEAFDLAEDVAMGLHGDAGEDEIPIESSPVHQKPQRRQQLLVVLVGPGCGRVIQKRALQAVLRPNLFKLVTVVDETTGAPLADRMLILWLGTSGKGGRTDASGVRRFEDLAPGTYKLHLKGVTEQKVVEVRAGEESAVTLRAPAASGD